LAILFFQHTCDEKFNFNHKCPNRHLLILQSSEETEISLAPKPPDQNQELEIESEQLSYNAEHFSLNALNDTRGTDIIRFQGKIQGIPMQILIDGDNTDSFLQPQIAKF